MMMITRIFFLKGKNYVTKQMVIVAVAERFPLLYFSTFDT